MKIKAVAYARVSTLLNQDVEHQLHGIRDLAKSRNFELVQEYLDIGQSGSSEKRPSLDQLVYQARRGKFKVVIVYSIDRLGRSVKHLLNLIDELSHYGVSLISIRENLDFTTPVGQMALTMLAAVAQLERQLISERIKVALAVKKANSAISENGWRCGRPPLSKNIEEKVIELKSLGMSTRQISKAMNGAVSRSSVSRIIRGLSQKPVLK